MNCPHCSNPISPTDRFCPNCGGDLGTGETIISRMSFQSPPAYEPPPAPPDYSAAPSPESAKGSRNTMLTVAVVLILLCCCCLIAIVAAYMLFGENILSGVSLALSLV
jgi:hypothetical protein